MTDETTILVMALVFAAYTGPALGAGQSSSIKVAANHTEVSIQTTNVHHPVPYTINGQGILNDIGGDALVTNPEFQRMLKESYVGSLRWPCAGHRNLPVFHFDNPDTSLSAQVRWNSWDPLHDQSQAIRRGDKSMTLGAFVTCLKNTSAMPVLLFNWTCAEYWSLQPDATKLYFRDPLPRDINGNPLNTTSADRMTSRQMQCLENRLMLKEYFAAGGPANPVVQMGGEIFLGWIVPSWEDATLNPEHLEQGEWIAKTVGIYIQDLCDFAKGSGYSIRPCVQFKESPAGGQLVLSERQPKKSKEHQTHLQNELENLIRYNGRNLQFLGCSMHYRSSWEHWLEQPRMKFGFLVPGGIATLKEAREHVRKTGAQLGFPQIDLIPHANSVGGGSEIASKAQKDEKELPKPAKPWQAAMMHAQYLMDLMDAGFQCSDGFPGFCGDRDKNLDAKDVLLNTVRDGAIQVGPEYFTMRMIGQVLKESTKMYADELVCDKSDDKLVVSALHPAGTQVIYVLIMNKHLENIGVTVITDLPVARINEVCRFSETETTAPTIKDIISVVPEFKSGATTMTVRLPPVSLTRVSLEVEH